MPDEQPVMRTEVGAWATRRTLSSCAVRAVTFQAPGEVRVEEKPDPEIGSPDEALVRVEASGICGSDLHIYHGRGAIEPGFTIGHEYVRTVVTAGGGPAAGGPGGRRLPALRTARRRGRVSAPRAAHPI